MLNNLPTEQLEAIETALREIYTADAPALDETAGFGIMLRYPMGWVEADGSPYHHPTGKRIRPLMVLFCAEAAGGDWHDALPAAAAVEILHNFSLIHDDIEDNSPIRHGRPTVWQVWGIANAINVGDATFTLSFQALHHLRDRNLPLSTVLGALHALGDTALTLTRGQHLDMKFEHEQTVTVEQYLQMIQGKTAALVSLSAYLGALIGCGDVERAAIFGEFALAIGLAFQIHDDILGIWGDPAVTGKSAASDILSRKKSLPVLYGLERSADLRARYTQTETFSEADITAVVTELEAVGALTYARQLEQDWNARALDALQRAEPVSPGTEKLRGLVDALFERQA